MAWPMISTPQCGDWRKTVGSGVEVVASPTGSDHQACFSADRTVSRQATRSLIWSQHESPPPEAPHIGTIEEENPHQHLPHQPPRRKRGEASSLRPGGKRQQNKLLIPERGRLRVESRLGMLRPQANHAQPVCFPASNVASAGRVTQAETRSAIVLLLCLIYGLRHSRICLTDNTK